MSAGSYNLLKFFIGRVIRKTFPIFRLKNCSHFNEKPQITTVKVLCTNIIDIKEKDKDVSRKINFRTKRYQIHNYIYYLPIIYNKLKLKLGL